MWMTWTFIPGLGWLSWLHAGIRTKHRPYFLIGLCYSIPFILTMVFSGQADTKGHSTPLYSAIISASMIAYIVGIIHVVMVRKSVDLRIKYANGPNTSAADEALERKIAADYGVAPRGVQHAVPPAVRQGSPPMATPLQLHTDEPAAAPVAINSADEQQIASLPGVGPILAKLAIRHRQSGRSFQSIEDFAQVLGLKPHVAQLLRSRVVVVIPRANPATPSAGEGHCGRIVDF
jgi:DNA uptake protein ComE-like DNA-binding protein